MGALEDLRWKDFRVLDQGSICLVDAMGDDAAICQAARISYGTGTKSVSDDRALIRYLMRNRHTTPFEMCEVKLRLRVPMDTWRQYIRHRTASVNEYSTRYSEAIDATQETDPGEWRLQSATNKQGSSGSVAEWPEGYPKVTCSTPDGIKITGHEAGFCAYVTTPGQYLSDKEKYLHEISRDVYEERLKFGVAREQARKDLPLSTYTEAYWKIDLHNLMHFLSLRMDSHAQQEIRAYADVIGHEIVRPLFPITWEAFVDYRLSGMSLTRLDIRVIGAVFLGMSAVSALSSIENRRERDECASKLSKLGMITEEVSS